MDFFGNRFKRSISRNEFYYFVDCFFRGLSKALINIPTSISFNQSFDASFMDMSDFHQPNFNHSTFRGQFFRMLTNGKPIFNLISEILEIVNLIFGDSSNLNEKDFVERMKSKEFKFTCFLESTHKTFQSKNEISSMKFSKVQTF